MKIRTQIVLAFLVLAVLPLTAIVVYSYITSTRAVRVASEQQAALLAEQMDERMSVFKETLRQGVGRLGDLPAETFADLASGSSTPERRSAAKRLIDNVGPVATMVESVEFVPAPPAARPVEAKGGAEVPPAPAPPPPADLPVIIDLEAIIREAKKSIPSAEELRLLEQAARRRHELPLDVASPSPSSSEPPTDVPDAPPTAPAAEPDAWEARLKSIEKQHEDRAASLERAMQNLEAHPKIVKVVASDLGKLHRQQEEMRVLFGHDVEAPVVRDGAVVGKVRATVRSTDAVGDILRRSPRRRGEIPFAVDAKGRLYTPEPADAARIRSLDISDGKNPNIVNANIPGWAVATTLDPDSRLTFGVARPFHDSLQDVRHTSARNFAYGLALIALALIGIVPVANHVTRDVELVTAGAERIAHGDLDTEVTVTSRNEVGRLALTFNRMARDLKENQQLLVEEERRRREHEVEQRLLKTEYDRKSSELEQARNFQLSLLPKSLPQHPRFDIGVFMKTATEVGGDYYDFHLENDGTLTVVVGDATGHGAAAGTMVTVIKSLFSGWAGQRGLREFLVDSASAIKRMDLGRMAMALQVARITHDRLTVASAGMPPVLVHRHQSGNVEEIALSGTPLGTLAFDYEQREVRLAAGDSVLLMSDGFPELLGSSGEPLGYTRVQEIFARVASRSATEVISALAAESEAWSGADAPNDDITFVVIRMRDVASAES